MAERDIEILDEELIECIKQHARRRARIAKLMIETDDTEERQGYYE